MDTTLYVTQEGLENLKNELKDLLEERPKVVQVVKMTRELGDLSENAGYQAAKDDLTMIDKRIAEIEEMLKVAKVSSKSLKNIVEVGAKVTIKDTTGKKFIYCIVGVSEADPMNNKISYESPIGKALYKKKVGEKTVVETPIGKTTFEIINLE